MSRCLEPTCLSYMILLVNYLIYWNSNLLIPQVMRSCRSEPRLMNCLLNDKANWNLQLTDLSSTSDLLIP